MKREIFPPHRPPRPLAEFTSPHARKRAPFDPAAVRALIDKHAAGIRPRPTPEQLRDWMNAESPVPEIYSAAIADMIAKMTGIEYMRFRRSCGASVRGLAHLAHETGVLSDRFAHYLDRWSDGGDRRERFDRGYGNLDLLVGR